MNDLEIKITIINGYLIIDRTNEKLLNIHVNISNDITNDIVFDANIMIPPIFVLNIGVIPLGEYTMNCTASDGKTFHKKINLTTDIILENKMIGDPFNGGGNGGGIVAIVQGLQDDQHKSTFTDFSGNASLTLQIFKFDSSNNHIYPPVHEKIFAAGNLPNEYIVDLSSHKPGTFEVIYSKHSEEIYISGSAQPKFTIE